MQLTHLCAACAVRLRGSSRDDLAAGVMQDLVAEGSVVQRPGVAPATLMAPGRVRASELPQFCPQSYIQHQAMDKGLYAEFSALQLQQYKVRSSAHMVACSAGQHSAACCLPSLGPGFASFLIRQRRSHAVPGGLSIPLC